MATHFNFYCFLIKRVLLDTRILLLYNSIIKFMATHISFFTDVEFQNVCFTYPSRPEKQVLTVRIHFHITCNDYLHN